MEFLLRLPAPFRFALRRPAAALAPAFVVLPIALWMATFGNWPLWRALADTHAPGSTPHSWFFLLGFGVLLVAGNAALLMLFAWRWTLKPVATLLLLFTAFGAYFMLTYGIAIDASMLTNVLQTDVREAGDLLSWRMPAVVLALAGPPLWWTWRQPVARPTPLRLLVQNTGWLILFLGVAVASVLATFQEFSSTMRNQPQLRYLINPLNTVYALGRIATQPLRMDTRTLLPFGRDAHLGASYAGQTKPPLLVLVVGETGRSGNFGLNGYAPPRRSCQRATIWPAQATRGHVAPARPRPFPACFPALAKTTTRLAKATMKTCWTYWTTPVWQSFGWTTSRAAKGCAIASRRPAPPPARIPPGARAASVSTRSCWRG